MEHSEDKDSKPAAAPQQHPRAQLTAAQQHQQWARSDRRFEQPNAPQQPYLGGHPAAMGYAQQLPQQPQSAVPAAGAAAALAAPNYPPAAEGTMPPYPQTIQPGQQGYQATYPAYSQPPPQQPYAASLYYQQQMPPPHPQYQQIPPPHSFIQPKIGRLPADRPLMKLSVSLIDTYKKINTAYYEERDARRAARAKEKGKGGGKNNNGWDDENYDYIITQGELFYGRYRIKERIGKGSFGQVVRAEDIESKRDVAIKIIKSKKPFLLQAKTEIELLTHLWEKDPGDEHNVVRLLTHFMYRNHQCLVFEMLSLNLYELLKNTQFGGVSLNLIRKFAKQVLKALSFLARSDVDIIHCDLKPENILLRHPKKSGVKVIDFGSSCRSNKRMYSYIQSRFYRSPEVMLGLPYSVAIDMWSLGCILVEMHTGEPLFSGSDQFDQMQKIVKLLGMVPGDMLDRAGDSTKLQFFERERSPLGKNIWKIRQTKPPPKGKGEPEAETPEAQPPQPVVPSSDPIASLGAVITAGSRQKKKFPPVEVHNSPRNYTLFVDLVSKMLAYEPSQRIKPHEALNHPFIVEQSSTTTSAQPPEG